MITRFAGFLLFILLQYSFTQTLPLEVKFSAAHLNVLDKKTENNLTGLGLTWLGWPDSVDGGFSIGGEFRYKIGEKTKIVLRVAYDNMRLFQNDVLNEWNWAYWEDTYIEFLPGLTVEDVNRTFRYTSSDSIYSAVFEPVQSLKELRLATGINYTFKLNEKIDISTDLVFGASLYTRELRMNEKWIKRFKLDTASTGRFDYEYRFNLVHFAPEKVGTRFFIEPALNASYSFTDNFSFEASFSFIQYIDRKYTKFIEDIFNIPENDQRYFPVNNKIALKAGLVIKY